MLDNLISKALKFRDGGSFGLKEKIFFFRELGYLIEGGISIVEAINIIKDNTENHAIKFICDNVYDSLKKGETLNRSMLKLQSYFNEGDINIIRSGEISGELQKVTKYLANEYEFIYDIRNKYIGAVMYPVIVFIVSIVAVFIIFKYVLPGILSILDQFESVQLPFTTKILIMVTNFIGGYSNHILIILFLVLFALSIFFSTDEGKRYFDTKVVNLPIVGKITRYYLLIRFLRYMKLLMNSGMNYVDIFQSLKLIMSNVIYKEMLDNLLVSIRKGENIVDVFRNYPVIIPPDIVVLMKVGEQTASTSKSIENGIWFYEAEFNKIITNLSKIIEPILIFFIGGLVAFIALSVFGIIGSVLDSVQQI